MNIAELKPGDYVRLHGCGRCDGCILKCTNDSVLNLDDVYEGCWSKLSTVSNACGFTHKTKFCSLDSGERFEILTPEQVMEIELSQ